MNPARKLRQIVPLLLVLASVPAQAEGPLTVGGLPPDNPGVPYRWDPAGFPLTYWTDLGNLGSQSNSQADDLVLQAFQAWKDVPTSSISFAKGAANSGKLTQDVTTANYMAVEAAILDCTTPLGGGVAQPRTVIYDTNGGIIDLVYGFGNSDTILGFATPVCPSSDGTNNFYQRGYAVMNGKNNPSVTELKAVMVHEFGHMLGLDHSQLNVECLFACSDDAMAGLPTMFPMLVTSGEFEMSTLATDDIAGISELYPEATFDTTTGRITGRIYFSDGMTQAQGFNVVARLVDAPGTTTTDESKRTAVSSSSGFLFTGDNGTPLNLYPGLSPSLYGSRDPTRIGYYEIPGLPPGIYTVEVEAFDSSFTLGSGVGPLGALGVVFPMPSATCPDGEFWNSSEANNDVCSDSTPVPVVANPTTPPVADVILNSTAPRYDAWEDGP